MRSAQYPNHELIVRIAKAFNRLLSERGGANDFAANAWRHLRTRGLGETGASGHVAFDSGGNGIRPGDGCKRTQVRQDLVGLGIATDDIDRFLEVLSEPDSTSGLQCSSPPGVNNRYRRFAPDPPSGLGARRRTANDRS